MSQAMVNWELHDGDAVERFAAALILLSSPRGNRITPSRGDRGVDIIVEDPDGADIYQVKRYTRPLTTAQQREVENSWRRFVDRVLPSRPIRSWTLVVPLDPTHERREWLMAFGERHPELRIGWMGRTQLDVLAAQHPKLVDYFFGAGQQRTLELMAQAISGGAPLPPGLDGAQLLTAIAQRQDQLVDALNEVDPFYRCEREVRHGQVPLERDDLEAIDNRGAMWIKYEAITPDRYSILRWFPLSAESHWLRPIGFRLTLQADQGTDQHDALRNFALYGAPINDILGEVTESTGPAGGRMPEGRGLFSILSAPIAESSRPDIELRISSPDGTPIASTDLVAVEFSSGLVAEPGYRLAGKDPSGYLTVEIQAGIADEPQRMSVTRQIMHGVTPHDLLPAARVSAAMTAGAHASIAIRDGGRELTGRWPLEDTDELRQNALFGSDLAQACQDLIEIQRHTLSRITLPPEETAVTWMRYIRDMADLIRGEIVESRRWHGVVEFTLDEPVSELDNDQTLEVLVDQLLRIDMVDSVVETDVPIRIHIEQARFERSDRDERPSLVPLTSTEPVLRYLRVDGGDWVQNRVMVRPVVPGAS